MTDPDEPVFRDFSLRTRLKFERFHRPNPQVFAAFKTEARKMKAEGHRRYSGQNIVERMRWDHRTPTRTLDEFKLNNDFVAIYVRLLIHRYPKEFTGFFELRKVGPKTDFYSTSLDEGDDI
jgi:hypothetical protein